MVLQRNKPINVWGWAKPGENVAVSFNKQTKYTTAGRNGKWLVTLNAEKAGGPLTLTVKGTNTLYIQNILVGEVWLCGGQSNMEMPIAGWGKINNFENEIKAANYPLIREFKVPFTISTTLKEDLTGGNWKICSPATAGEFSSTAYFFARKLYNELKVPIGLVNSSRGGTQSEAWTSVNGFEATPELRYIATEIRTGSVENILKKRNESIIKNLEKPQEGSTGPLGRSANWKNEDFDDNKWNLMKLPGVWEDQGFQVLDGIVWFRKTIDVSPGDAGKTAMVQLAQVDESDETYLNGVKIGETGIWHTLRKYTIPAGLLKPGKNLIAIKVTDTRGTGGVYGNPAAMKITIDSKEQSLAGDWRFRIDSVFNLSESLGPNDYPGLLFNAMINPLVNYTIKGAIWYQGEANAGRAFQYRIAFPMMIKDWRQHFKQGDFPFYFVQLPTFGSAKSNSNNGSQWAELREAQDQTLALPNTGMVVTTDIGDPGDIHPKNKQDVGKRLADIALNKLYQKKGECTGPRYQSMKIIGTTVSLSFTHTGSGLQAKDKGSRVNGFEIAGADKKFHLAQAIISGNKIMLHADSVLQPVAVRYNWADDASSGNLFNRELYPAAPFRTDNWEGITVRNRYTY
jgi:sialate O-acetylesterase